MFQNDTKFPKSLPGSIAMLLFSPAVVMSQVPADSPENAKLSSQIRVQTAEALASLNADLKVQLNESIASNLRLSVEQAKANGIENPTRLAASTPDMVDSETKHDC